MDKNFPVRDSGYGDKWEMLEAVVPRADAGIVLYDAVLIARRCCMEEVAFYAATADDIPAARSWPSIISRRRFPIGWAKSSLAESRVQHPMNSWVREIHPTFGHLNGNINSIYLTRY